MFPPSPVISNCSPPSLTDIRPEMFITIVVLAIAVILFASLYLLLRFLRRRRISRVSDTLSNSQNLRRVTPVERNPLIDSLPVFAFGELNGTIVAGGDCAVCLSRFEAKDFLRLLPLCCHAFHVECIDVWLNANQSCPVCRSPVFLPDSQLFERFSLLDENSLSRSFRVEIGSISRRGVNSGEIRRSYSISGSFDYVLNDVVSEVNVGSFRRPSEIKVEPSAPPLEEEALAAEVGQQGGWLKDFLSNSSRTMSFRGSARWLGGSSRRSNTELVGNRDSEVDLEASRLGEEISELFRWLSGV